MWQIWKRRKRIRYLFGLFWYSFHCACADCARYIGWVEPGSILHFPRLCTRFTPMNDKLYIGCYYDSVCHQLEASNVNVDDEWCRTRTSNVAGNWVFVVSRELVEKPRDFTSRCVVLGLCVTEVTSSYILIIYNITYTILYITRLHPFACSWLYNATAVRAWRPLVIAKESYRKLRKSSTYAIRQAAARRCKLHFPRYRLVKVSWKSV